MVCGPTISQSETETETDERSTSDHHTKFTSGIKTSTTRSETHTHTHVTPVITLASRQTTPLLPPSLSRKISVTPHWKENNRKRVYEPRPPFSFSPLNSIFPLLHFYSLASLFTFTISSALPYTSFLNQLLRSFSSYMALYSLIEFPSSLGGIPLSSRIFVFFFFLAMFHKFFLCNENLQLQIPPFAS